MKLTIEKVVYGGNGLSRQGDQTIFVPFTLPGETVEASCDDTSNGIVEARLSNVINPSQHRITARCDHFGECGGCHYQHADYDEQLAIKRQILHETLERADLHTLPAIGIHSGDPWHYRNRIRVRITRQNGQLRAGYLRRGTTEFLPVHMCSIAAPLLWRTVEALLAVEGDAARWIEAAEEAEVFTNEDQSKLQLTLFLHRQPPGSFDSLCNVLQSIIPELAGAGVAIFESKGKGRKTQRFRAGPTWGTPGLNYRAGEETYWVSRGGFFQVNRTLLDKLVALVTHDRRGELAWDLYAGVGLFSRVLTKRFANVVAVEAAADDLARSFRGHGQRAVAATTVEFLRQAVLERDRPDLIVLDPPRAGIGSEVCTLLGRLRPASIVYVSCDPVTLGRDLRQMVDSGYRLCELHMIDLFPQTFHQETVAVLSYSAT
jgi:23S rRNA (uracil1939-C5)-methyltransferase